MPEWGNYSDTVLYKRSTSGESVMRNCNEMKMPDSYDQMSEEEKELTGGWIGKKSYSAVGQLRTIWEWGPQP